MTQPRAIPQEWLDCVRDASPHPPENAEELAAQARATQRIGNYLAAGHLFEQAHRWHEALAMFQVAGRSDEHARVSWKAKEFALRRIASIYAYRGEPDDDPGDGP